MIRVLCSKRESKEVSCVSDERTPRRRRRQMTAEPEAHEAPLQHNEEEASAAPVRIVVTHQEDTPDWMVSATKTSGAASRRAQKNDAAPKKTVERAGGDIPAALVRKERPAPADEAQAEPEKRAPQNNPKPAPKPAAKPKKKTKKKGSKARARRIRRNALIVIAAAAALTLVVALGMTVSRVLHVKQTLDRGDGVFYPNIYVNDIPLAGKTLDQAAQDVTAQVSNKMATFKITLRTQDGRTWDITSRDLNMQYDIADQLDQLWAIGHTGSSQTRYEQVKALDEEPVVRHTTLRYDMTLVNQILAQIKTEVDKSPVNALRVDDPNRWPPYSYTDDAPGQELDITGLGEQICGMVDRLESGVVELTPTVKEAAVTREYLEGQIVQLAMFETGIGKTGDYVENRHENIRLGTEKFNRLQIRPGESVSFNKVTGLRNAANGYQVALELAYGEYVEGTGGGICQVSSTLYNALMGAGPAISVTKRTAHSHPSNYVEKGLDATVQDNRLDLVFRNDTTSDIFIETKYYKKKNYYYTQFVIYGRPDPNGYTYELVSQVAQELPIPDVKIVQDKAQKYVVYTDEQYVASEGEEGYVVDVYRVTKDAHGLEVAREKLYTDTYKPVEPVTYVGVIPKETPVPPGYVQTFD